MAKCTKCEEEYPDYFPECPTCGNAPEKVSKPSRYKNLARIIVYGFLGIIILATTVSVILDKDKHKDKSISTSPVASKTDAATDVEKKQEKPATKDYNFNDCKVLFDSPYTSSKDSIEKLSDIVSADDKVAFDRMLSLPGNGLIPKGTRVQVEHIGTSYAKVRPRGGVSSVWTIRKSLECVK
jgi:hypothetical protein